MTTVIICFVIFLVHTAVARILLYKQKLCSKTTFPMLLVGVGYGLLTLMFGLIISQFLYFDTMTNGLLIFCFFALGAAYCCSVTDNKYVREITAGSYILSMVLCAYIINVFGMK